MDDYPRIREFLGQRILSAHGRLMVRCDRCQRAADLQTTKQQRTVAPDVDSVGILCSCGHWSHVWYETPAMALGRQALHFVNHWGTPEQKQDTEQNWELLFVAEQQRINGSLRDGR